MYCERCSEADLKSKAATPTYPDDWCQLRIMTINSHQNQPSAGRIITSGNESELQVTHTHTYIYTYNTLDIHVCICICICLCLMYNFQNCMQ